MIGQSKDNSAHSCLAHVILASQFALSISSGCIKTANISDLFARKPRGVMSLPYRLGKAPLGNCVCHIVSLGAKKQMPGIAARWVVAAMQHLECLIHETVMQFVGDPMGTQHTVADSYSPVAISIFRSRPIPAVIGAASIDLPPQPFSYGAALFMMIDEPYGLAFDMPTFAICGLGNWGGLSAATFAQFYGGVVRGMIVHSNSLLSAVAHAAGCFQHRCGASIGRFSITHLCVTGKE